MSHGYTFLPFHFSFNSVFFSCCCHPLLFAYNKFLFRFVLVQKNKSFSLQNPLFSRAFLIYSRRHEDEIQPDSATGRKWFHTMAGRDENGSQVTRRDSAGISKEGEYQARFSKYFYNSTSRRDPHFSLFTFSPLPLPFFLNISQLWLTLAERHLEQRGVDWKQAEKICFNEWSNPDDEELGIQIVKVRNVYPFLFFFLSSSSFFPFFFFLIIPRIIKPCSR